MHKSELAAWILIPLFIRISAELNQPILVLIPIFWTFCMLVIIKTKQDYKRLNSPDEDEGD